MRILKNFDGIHNLMFAAWKYDFLVMIIDKGGKKNSIEEMLVEP